MWIEGTPWSREIHQTRPRAPFAGATYGGAARTASTGLRRPGRCRGGGGASGPRIKYHPRYVPFENATSFSILSAFCSFASRRSLSLSLSLNLSPIPSSSFCRAFLARVCRGVHELSFVFSNSTAPSTRRHVHASRIPSSSFQRIADGVHWYVGNAESSRAHREICTMSHQAFRDLSYKCRDVLKYTSKHVWVLNCV